MIQGLESNNYCVHVPTPAIFSGLGGTGVKTDMSVEVNGVSISGDSPFVLYPFDGKNYFDLSQIVKLYIKRYEDLKTYTAAVQTSPMPYRMVVNVHFDEKDEEGRVIYQEDISKVFYNCTLDSGIYTPNTDERVKAWKCYPFSWINGDNVVYQLLTTDVKPTVPGKFVEYDLGCCKGAYIKWLNELGHYNYWFFPRSIESKTEASEIERLKRNIFGDSYNFSNEYTAGFEARRFITVRDLVNKEYWYLFESLVSSPEVYMLKEEWEIGTPVEPQDWIRIIQSDVEFERIKLMRNQAELEFEFELPKPYTQKLI